MLIQFRIQIFTIQYCSHKNKIVNEGLAMHRFKNTNTLLGMVYKFSHYDIYRLNRSKA